MADNRPTLSTSGRKSWNLSERWQRLRRYFRLRLTRLPATPHQVALGVAIGVLAGHLPVIPIQMLLALLLAFLLGGSRVGAVLGTWVTNPINIVPYHFLYYLLGRAVVPFEVPVIDPAQLDLDMVLEVGWKLYLALSAGSLMLGIPLSIASYFLTQKMVILWRRRTVRVETT